MNQKNNNENNNIESIDRFIKQIINDYFKNNKNNLKKPISLNIQLSNNEEEQELFDDTESFLVNRRNIYITVHTPYNLSRLRFDVDESDKKLMIKSNDYQFYKEFWFGYDIIKESLETSYKNHVLEVKLKRDISENQKEKLQSKI